MRVGVFRSVKQSSVSFEYIKGEYDVYADSNYVGRIAPSGKLIVIINQSKVNVRLNSVSSFICSKLVLVQIEANSVLQVNSINPQAKSRKYNDNFEVTSVEGRLNVVNLVEPDNYLSGVIESEGGGGRHIEYYKVQALMSRTYAFQNRSRHIKEGFELCDGVHCQAYHQMLTHTPKIREAVSETRNEVLVDKNNKMVTTYFYANCGGQTSDASYVWNNSVPYCVPFKDTFCIHTKQAHWTKQIPKTDWINFLNKEYGFPKNDSLLTPMAYNFEQLDRMAFFIHPSLGIPLRDLRSKFNLKSTYFSVSDAGNNVLINGRGFGHGVGLCQEGAMGMASAGIDYKQIAKFYFENVDVLNSSKRNYFSQKPNYSE